MIKKKEFYNIDKLNLFVSENKVQIVNIETGTERYPIDLPTMSGTAVYNTCEVYYLWYSE
jgi:hypothetical protein